MKYPFLIMMEYYRRPFGETKLLCHTAEGQIRANQLPELGSGSGAGQAMGRQGGFFGRAKKTT